MKTIKDISDIAGVSRTSIYNLIKKNNIPTFKREGKTYIDENGENLIIAYYCTEQHKTLKDIAATSQKEEDEVDYGNFQPNYLDNKQDENGHIIGLLEKELDKNYSVIQELLQSNKILSQALATDKINDTARLIMKEKVRGTAKKENIFKRIFKRNLKAGL